MRYAADDALNEFPIQDRVQRVRVEPLREALRRHKQATGVSTEQLSRLTGIGDKAVRGVLGEDGPGVQQVEIETADRMCTYALPDSLATLYPELDDELDDDELEG